jgi:hypothetical protein
MGSDLDDLSARANQGDAEAQRDLAIRFHNGEGVARDPDAAAKGLKQAAENGDPWAQTTYAIQLRTTKEPEKERESIRWLMLAADECDARARLTLATQQALGIGTEVDFESAAVNMIMSSLSGYEDARRLFAPLASSFEPEQWERIAGRVKWSRLTFFMGEPIEERYAATFRQFQLATGDFETTQRPHEPDDDDPQELRHRADVESVDVVGPQARCAHRRDVPNARRGEAR